ncbi:hypothetical protein Tco_0473987 [Tanacetum coccineum]
MVMVAMMYGGDAGSGGSDWRLECPLWCVAARRWSREGWCDGWWWDPTIEVASDLVVGDGVEGDGVIDWLQVEDTNSTFFHRSVKTRMRRSRIDCVMDHDNVLHEGTEVPIIFVDHYMQFLGVESPITPLNHEGLFVRKLSQIPARIMIRDVNDDEIRTAMFSIGNDKAPGPDGFTFVFFKKA